MTRTSSVAESDRGHKRPHGSPTSARPRKPGKAPGAIAAQGERGAVADEERQQLIAEGAYYRAERRGFQPGNELIDWLEAEQDVDAMLNEPYEDAEAPLV